MKILKMIFCRHEYEYIRSVTTREASVKQVKIDSNSNITASYSSNVITLGGGLPVVTSADEGKILKVVNDAWALVDPT